jgi:hypothetical protein
LNVLHTSGSRAPLHSGASVGDVVGFAVGCRVGKVVGEIVLGAAVGLNVVGARVGKGVGDVVVGATVGTVVGVADGWVVGLCESPTGASTEFPEYTT